MLNFFKEQATQKISSEGWYGRNKEVKRDNFVHCWTTEEAFKQLLISNGAWFRHRGLYFGDSQGAGADFTVKLDGKEVTVGLRSVAADSLYKWKSVAYPDDRFRTEKDKIANYHVVCNHLNGHAKFFGIISKEDLLNGLEEAKVLYSPKNQEKFRVVSLDLFKFSLLQELMGNMDKV